MAAQVPAPRSYLDYVDAQRTRHPSLEGLVNFLRNEKNVPEWPSRALCLQYAGAGPPTQVGDGNIDTILAKIQSDKAVKGRVLIVENPSRAVFSKLGSELDIDPFFFANYIGTGDFNLTGARPVEAARSQSKVITQPAFIFNHHHIYTIEPATKSQKAMRKSHVPRNFRVLPNMGSTQLGLMRSCCAVLRIRRDPPEPWLCLILLDAPIEEPRDDAVWDLKGITDETKILSFLGGVEAHDDPPPFSKSAGQADARITLWNSAVEYFDRDNPGLDLDKPTMLSLAAPLQRVVLSEWLSYAELMVRCIKKYEYSIKGGRLTNDDSLEEDLRDLQRWRRRSMQTIGRLQTLSRFVEYWHDVEVVNANTTGAIATGQAKRHERSALQQDIDEITAEIERHSHHLEAMVPTVTSFSQLLDSHRSVAEARNVTQLTYAALFFVPMSFIASLFGMDGKYGPGQSDFKTYWTVAVPIAVGIILLARAEWKKTWKWLKAKINGKKVEVKTRHDAARSAPPNGALLTPSATTRGPAAPRGLVKGPPAAGVAAGGPQAVSGATRSPVKGASAAGKPTIVTKQAVSGTTTPPATAGAMRAAVVSPTLGAPGPSASVTGASATGAPATGPSSTRTPAPVAGVIRPSTPGPATVGSAQLPPGIV